MKKRKSKYKKWKLCIICGKAFFAKKDCETRNQLYCSIKCSGISQIGRKPTEKQLKALEKGRYKGKEIGGWKWKNKSKEKLSKSKRGIKLSKEHREALSKVKKGKPVPHLHTPEANKKLSEALLGKPQPWNRGKNHHNWQGGITELNWQIRNSLKYKNWRRLIHKRDNWTCQLCGKKGGKIHVDHKEKFAKILYENNIKTLEDALNCKEIWDIDNGRVLCKDCHEKTNTWGGGNFYNGKAKMRDKTFRDIIIKRKVKT